jgi:tetratricopeptide (TPR) repeat protein
MQGSRMETDRPSRGRQVLPKLVLIAALSWLGFFALLELVLWGCGVPLLVDREDPFRGFSGLITVFEDQGEIYRTRLPKPGGTFNDQSFQSHKPSGGLRIFTLGGSSSYGFPWSAPVAFTAVLGDVLSASHPDRSIEAINASGVSYAMHRLNIVADELFHYEPDIFIIYSGHNEFIEPEFFNALKRRGATRNRFEYALANTHVYSAMQALLGEAVETPRRRQSGFDERVRRADSATYSAAAKKAVIEEYQWRLQRLVRRAQQRGIRVVICTVPSNLRDWRPEQSVADSTLDPAGRQRWERALHSGRQRLEAGDFEAALDDFGVALESSAQHALTHYLMGQSHEGLGHWAQAGEAYRRARDKDASPSRALSASNEAVRQVAREEGALLVDIDELFATQSPHGLVGFNLIEDYVHPTLAGHREIAWHLWEALEQSGWVDEAITVQRQQFDILVDRRGTPNNQANPSWLYNQGIVLAVQGRDDQAITKFRQTVELLPTHGGALGNLVSLLLKQDKTDEALPLAKRLVEMYPDFPNFQLYLAMAYVSDGNLSRAKTHLLQVLRLRSHDPMAHYQLGRISETSGEEAEAAAHFERAIASYADFPEARSALGALLLRQGSYEKAREHLLRAVSGGMHDATVLHNLAKVYEAQGDEQTAKSYYEQAAEADTSRQGFDRH